MGGWMASGGSRDGRLDWTHGWVGSVWQRAMTGGKGGVVSIDGNGGRGESDGMGGWRLGLGLGLWGCFLFWRGGVWLGGGSVVRRSRRACVLLILVIRNGWWMRRARNRKREEKTREQLQASTSAFRAYGREAGACVCVCVFGGRRGRKGRWEGRVRSQRAGFSGITLTRNSVGSGHFVGTMVLIMVGPFARVKVVVLPP